MPTSLLDQVREACREVSRRATLVRIDFERLPAYAASLPPARAAAPALDPAHHYHGDVEGTVAFVVTLDAVNFGSGWFPHLRKRPGLSGYFTVATSLGEHFRAHGPIPADALAAITADECARLFGQDAANVEAMELMALFARALNDLGRYLLERFGGSFTALVAAAEGSAERLAGLLRQMAFFDDVEEYAGARVPFFKRAQLTAADLSLALGGEGPGRFRDLHRLTIFADNLVPHVLRVDGLLRYDAGLAERIDAGELIAPGSPEEVEIRACALHAVELLTEALRDEKPRVTAMGLDYLLWNRGQEPHYKQVKPRHRTRTVFY
ncbi:MAG: hypothetical protein JWM27_3448 [Gemmatimonadetes bacterium]|nr:hypothetical protein [Gemmatimonadota bacterium]